MTAVPARFSKSPPNTTRLWPTLGQHNREILSEAGCSEQEIDEILGIFTDALADSPGRTYGVSLTATF